ncbi:hypothetical protein AS188_03760 [Kocuria flava]|nr:hypothetical protein [Kocuria flava]ALU41042.1 hypothetical protein AS188_03760 [Kocuria flava]
MTRTSPWFVLAAVLAALFHLVVGFYYLASGLMAPLWAVVLLAVWWVLLVPVAAAATWFGVMAFGSSVLGWRP